MSNGDLMIADQPGDKYDDIFGPGGERPGWSGGGYGGGGGQPYGGGSNAPNPFIPGFGGQAQGWGGFAAQGPWGGGMGQRRRLPSGMGRMAFGAQPTRMDGGGGQMMSGGQIQSMGGVQPQGGAMPGAGSGPGPGPPPRLQDYGGMRPGGVSNWMRAMAAWRDAGGGGQWQGFKNSHELLGGVVGGDPRAAGPGGAFGINPPPGILAAIRGQAVQDAGARERSARLGLQARAGSGGVDPSTYGFQSLMSQLGGQDQTARAMSQADLGLRQQQLDFLQRALFQFNNSNISLEGQNRQSRAAWEAGGGGSGWGQVGGLFVGPNNIGAQAIRGGRTDGGGGGGQAPTMGQPGYQYPYYGG